MTGISTAADGNGLCVFAGDEVIALDAGLNSGILGRGVEGNIVRIDDDLGAVSGGLLQQGCDFLTADGESVTAVDGLTDNSVLRADLSTDRGKR